MGRERQIQSALLGCAAILAASAWASPAAGCHIPAAMSVEMPNATEIVPHQQQPRRAAPAAREARPVANRATAPAAASGARLDCRACVAMMPPLNQDLMPLVPFADQILRIHPIDPDADKRDGSTSKD